MSKEIDSLVDSWSDESSTLSMLTVRYLFENLYVHYEPALPPNEDFWTRLISWLNSAGDDQETQKRMFNSLPRLCFLGPEEFRCLYKYAYDTTAPRWIIDSLDLKLDDVSEPELQEAARNTWFCPISDSMRINEFYHVNDIVCLLYTSPSPRDRTRSRMPSSA